MLAFLSRLLGLSEELLDLDLLRFSATCGLEYPPSSASTGATFSTGISLVFSLGFSESEESPSESPLELLEPLPELESLSESEEELLLLWSASSFNYSYFFSRSMSFGALAKKLRRSSVSTPRPIEVK